MTDAVLRDAQVLWDYMCLDMTPAPADVLVGFGCYDETVPLRVVELWKQGLAPWVVFTGGLGRNTSGLFRVSEAERFAAIAVKAGLPESAILLETRSANSAENFLFTKALLEGRNIPTHKILAVHKPYMERRVYAAAAVYWPQAEFILASPRVTIPEHIRAAQAVGMTEKGVLDTLVGDVQRMELYAQKGYQIPQEVPGPVRAAYERLVEAGYTSQLTR